MQNAEFHTFPDNPAVASAFAAAFHKWTTKPPHPGKLTVALSGGSTPKLLFEHLAKHYADRIDWNNIHFYWGDERCVDPADAESNFGVSKQLLFDKIEILAENVHRVFGENAPAEERIRYEKEISDHVKLNEHGIPNFDLVILGMGSDGHTASIFPHQIELLNSGNVCEVATHPESGQQRITLTGQVLNAAGAIVYLITGAGKAQVLSEVVNRRGKWESYPVSHVDNVGPMDVYLDSDAAAKLA